ncbi:MAG: DUF308 domain-containing protein [Bacilli bacterium]|nr:DUF308 domain-containing protein [Bacilli bacterium]
MKEIISKFTKSSIISSFALVALAILLITDSEATITGISYIIGAVLIAIGALAEINYLKNIKEKIADLDIIYGIVCVILGVLVITNPLAIEGVIPFVIGFIIVVNSAIKLQYSLELRKENNELWFSTLILSIIMTVCGIVLIFNPFQGRDIVSIIIGIFILIYAILDLISTFVIKNTFKRIQNAISETVAKEQELIENKIEEEEEEVKEAEVEETEKPKEKKKSKKKTEEGE